MSETDGVCGRCGGTASWLDISGTRKCVACDPPRPPVARETRIANRIWIWIGILLAIAAAFAVTMAIARARRGG